MASGNITQLQHALNAAAGMGCAKMESLSLSLLAFIVRGRGIQTRRAPALCVASGTTMADVEDALFALTRLLRDLYVYIYMCLYICMYSAAQRHIGVAPEGSRTKNAWIVLNASQIGGEPYSLNNRRRPHQGCTQSCVIRLLLVRA